MLKFYKNRRAIILPTLLLCFISNSAVSQNVSVTNSLDPINPVIVTATRIPTPANDVLADNTYIGREEIENAGQSSLPELLQAQRGVQVSTTGGAGGISSIYLRGTSNAQSLVLVDGVKVGSNGGGAIWNAIPLSLIDHIEIIYGPQSTYYGSEAMGGVVQIFTKQGSASTQIDASAGYGTYNTTISSASVSGSMGKENSTTYSVGVSQENSSGFNAIATNNPQNPVNKPSNPYSTNSTGYSRLGVSGSLANKWEEGQELGVKIFASRNAWQYSSNDFLTPNNPAIYNQYNDLSIFSIYSNNQITANWQSQLQLSSATNNGQNVNGNSNDKLTTPTYDMLWQNNIKVGSDILQILAERKMEYAYNQNSPNGSMCNNDPSIGKVDCLVSVLRTTNSFAGSYQLKRGNNLATVAIRNDDITGYGNKTTYNAAYGYFFTKEVRTNVNYGTGFRAPAFNDLYYPGYGNVNLKPESNRNIEAGIHYEKGLYGIHLTAYQNSIQNYIVPINCPVDPSLGYASCTGAYSSYYQGAYPANFSSVRIKGASLGVDGHINDLTLKGSVDAMSTVDQTTGLDVPNRANWTGNLLADYKFNKLDLGSNITLSGARWGGISTYQTYNTNWMPGYTIVNFYANYELEKHITIFARLNNAFNSQYQTSYGYANPSSNIFVGLRYSMK